MAQERRPANRTRPAHRAACVRPATATPRVARPGDGSYPGAQPFRKKIRRARFVDISPHLYRTYPGQCLIPAYIQASRDSGKKAARPPIRPCQAACSPWPHHGGLARVRNKWAVQAGVTQKRHLDGTHIDRVRQVHSNTNPTYVRAVYCKLVHNLCKVLAAAGVSVHYSIGSHLLSV